jgi:sugar O-acyltransferase (sialic acid O-acetyltransferase NeuD family)
MPWILWGSSGHGKVLAEAIALHGGRVVALVDNDPSARACVPGAPLLHGERGLQALIEARGLPAGACAAVAVGGSRGADRRSIAAILRAAGLELAPVVHPRATVSASATVSAGCHILANAVVAAEARLGEMTIVNHGAVVDHECSLGAGVHVAPGATLCGCVTVEEDAMIGAGATVLPRLRIGRGAVVGAGAVVIHDVPGGAVVTGVPAKEGTP